MAQSKEALRKLRQKYHLGEYSTKRRLKYLQRTRQTGRFGRHVGNIGSMSAIIPINKKRRSYMAKKHRRSRRSSSMTSGLAGKAIGIGAYILFEALLEPKIASIVGSGTVLNVVELATGMWLSRKGGVVGEVGKAAVYINAYLLIKPLLQSTVVQSAF